MFLYLAGVFVASVEVRVYSVGMTLVTIAKTGAENSGWFGVPLPTMWTDNAPNEVYFVLATPYQGNSASRAPKLAKVVLLR